MSNRVKLLVLVGIAALTGGLVLTATGSRKGATDTPPASVAPSIVAAASPLPPLPPARTYPDAVLGPDAPPPPTNLVQSRLWIAAGAWWTAMIVPGSLETHIFELVDEGRSWRDTGTLVDARRLARPDCLWDGHHLYIVSATPGGSASGAARLSRFSFDAKARRFVPDPNFPITITPGAVGTIVLARDSTGRLWTTWVAMDGRVMVDRSVGGDLFWGEPFVLPFPEASVTPDDVAAVVSAGNRIGLIWGSRQTSAYHYSSHEDGDPDDAWSPVETALTGPGLVGSHLSVAATPDGRVLAVVRTSLGETPNISVRSPQVLLLVRALDGTWTNDLVGRIDDHQTHPSLVLDDSGGVVYVWATTPGGGGTIAYKRARIEDPAFVDGVGDPLVASSIDPQVGSGMGTKQAVDPASGLVVLGFDPSTSRYVHGVLDLGGGVAAGPVGTPASRDPGILVDDDFDPWPAGTTPADGWELRPSDPVTAMRIAAVPSAADHSVRLDRSPADGVRACKAFVPTEKGTLTVEGRVRLVAIGAADAVITSVRGPDGESASVRFGQGGTFAYYAGPVKIRTTRAFRLGTWYRSIVVVHLDRGRYDWRLTDAAGHVVVAVAGIPFRDAAVRSADRTCLASSIGRGPGLFFDDVRVAR